MAKKNVAFKIRVDEQLKQEFLDVCSKMDIPAAQVIRGFMRNHIDMHENIKQQDWFETQITAPKIRTQNGRN